MNSSESNHKPDGKLVSFTKLHEKVQIKYERMQKRLLKSQSIDCLDNLCVETCNRSNDELSFSSEVFIDNDDFKVEVVDYDKQEGNIEDIKTIFFEDTVSSDQDYVYKDIQYDNEVEYRKPKYLSPKNRNSLSFFGNDFKNKSTESLSDLSRDLGDASPGRSPGFRKRLRDKFSAMKEKRKQDKQDVLPRERRDSWYIFSNTTKQDPKPVKRVKEATVTIAIIELLSGVNYLQDDKTINYEKATNLPIYCRLRLGTDKIRSKNVKRISSKYQWLELFNFNYYGNDLLEITLWNKDTVIGKHALDLTDYEKEKTHQLPLEFSDCYPDIKLLTLLTITGTTENTVIDGEAYETTIREMDQMKNKFAWNNSDDSADVGYLSVIIYGAKGLFGQNCYCIVELDNERRHTFTEYKTNDPIWMKNFVFNVKDITSILEITVHDEKRSEDVGKISVPLLKINDGEKKWYALKDNIQRERAKGNNPRILLEMRISWNLIRASVKVINPKEAKFLESEMKIDTKVFASNINRSKAILSWIYGAFNIFKTCFEWESRITNIIALTIWLIFCWYFKVWMLPVLLLIPFVWYRPKEYYLIDWNNNTNDEDANEYDEIAEAASKSDKEAKTTILQKIHLLQAMVATVQKTIGSFATLGESVKNLYNFTTPYVSILAILLLSAISLVMYLIPTKYMFMAWGVHKFTRKILRPNRIPNNEILDLLSRVPDDIVMQNCEELPLIDEDEEDSKNM